MKLGLYASVPDTVYLELETEARAVDDHLEREVEVVELDAACRREARKQGAGDGVEICCQCAHMH